MKVSHGVQHGGHPEGDRPVRCRQGLESRGGSADPWLLRSLGCGDAMNQDRGIGRGGRLRGSGHGDRVHGRGGVRRLKVTLVALPWQRAHPRKPN